jgi:hypothetical protein
MDSYSFLGTPVSDKFPDFHLNIFALDNFTR